MALDPDLFRSVLGRFASGVTILTVRDAEGRDHGMTVSAFASLSLSPPLVLACIDRTASMQTHLAPGTWFVVNILSSTQEALSRRFANMEAGARFDGIGYERSPHGAAVLDDVLAHIDCRVFARQEVGDHVLVIGEVEHAATRDDRPLLYYRGGYAQLER